MSIPKLRLVIEITLLVLVGSFVFHHEKGQSVQGNYNEKNTTQIQTAEHNKHPANKTTSFEKVSDRTTQFKTRSGTRILEKLVEKPSNILKDDSIEVIAQPASIHVLVNKHYELPDSYHPKDLVMTKIPYIPSAPTERRLMRRSAATAIEKLFAAAKKQGVRLLGVSAYRSHASQESLFNYYVNEDGYRMASTYSALPGTSEHETGLAIDVTGGNGKCAADDCFDGTKEAKWLQSHAAKYGFIIRYPKGKEAVTGYKYEPWHLRYVGVTIARIIMKNGITLEEYYDTVPVNGDKQLLTFAH